MVATQPAQQIDRPPDASSAVLAKRRMALAVLAVLTVAALVGIGVLVPRISSAAARDGQRADVLHVARQETVNFTTLDYRHLDRDLGRVLRGSTGDFRKQFQAGSKNLTSLVTANKAVAKGQVLDAGLVSSDADSAVVLVVADSTVTNTASPKGEQRHYRLQLSLVLHDGQWLVSDLTFVG
jgi:Mce-associated membrane protein